MTFTPVAGTIQPSPKEGSSTVISVEVEGEIAKAISAISDSADENSLLRNPFETYSEVLEQGDFISPLTKKDKDRIEEIKKLVALYTNLIEVHTNIPNSYIFAKSIKEWKRKRNVLIKEKVALEEKERKAYDAWLEERQRLQKEISEAQSKASQVESANKEIIEEFQRLVDKFDDWNSAGLKGLNKRVRPHFERAARNYISDEPEILFISEYIVDGKFYGALLCLKVYRDSTHYEFFKRNLFQQEDFERFLFLNKASLESETEKLMPYVEKALGLKLNKNKVFLILDHRVKKDRIYEYKVAAARVPQKAVDVDFDLILEVQGLLKTATLSPSATVDLRSFAGNVLSSTELGWVLATVNETFSLFGRSATDQPLTSILQNPVTQGSDYLISVPKNVEDVLNIIQECITTFGARDTMEHLVSVLGGLPYEFIQAFVLAIDDQSNRFSYKSFRDELKKRVNIFKLIFEIAETKDDAALQELSTLNLQLPNNTGTESLTTILGLSTVFRFLNDTYLISTYAQEDDTFERLVQVRALIAINRGDEDPADVAIQNQADSLESLNEGSDGNLYGVFQDQGPSSVGGGLPGRGGSVSSGGVINI